MEERELSNGYYNRGINIGVFQWKKGSYPMDIIIEYLIEGLIQW